MTSPNFPSVREQAKRWAAGPAKAAEAPPRETLDARNLKLLGSVSRSQFATAPDGRELQLKGPAMPHAIEQAGPDAILVHKLVRAADGRPRSDTYLASVVEPGTYERMRKRKTYTPKAPRVGPIDGLAELRKPASRLPVWLGPDDGSPNGIIKGALSKRPMLLVTDGADVPITVRGLVEVVNAEGANLRYYSGKVLCDWTQVTRWRALLIAVWPLVSAHLAGTPELCAYEHKGTAPLADTLDPAGVPLCNGHVGQGPRAA